MKYRHFSIEEREQIQQLLWEKRSVRVIARQLDRSPSSIAREINRNIPPLQRRYAPRLAHARALWKRTSRGRIERLKNEQIRSYAIDHLKEGWSPEQISGRLPIEHPDCSISHEAIYQFVYARVSKASDLVYAQQEDPRNLKRALDNTVQLFQEEFGEEVDPVMWFTRENGEIIQDAYENYLRRGELRGSWNCSPIISCNGK